MIALLLALSLLSPRGEALGTINERRHGDCPPLRTTGPALIRGARAWSREMAETSLHHSELEVGRWSLVGEVIGVGRTVPEIVDALFRSADHRHILMDCRYDKIAIGIYRAARVWFTARLYAL